MKKYIVLAIGMFFSVGSFAQNTPPPLVPELSGRITIAPESVSKSFREAGMDPADHYLTPVEKAKVESAFAYCHLYINAF